MFMQIEHIAVWTDQLERLKDFYVTYFQAKAGKIYYNATKGLESYFLSFSSGVRLELMKMPGIQDRTVKPSEGIIGYTHISFATGSERSVDELTNRLRRDGFHVIADPRYTGDGYYESVVLDPDGNQVEITV
jgi:lactoylglutathione lyase